MKANSTRVTQKPLFYWSFRYNRGLQALLLVLIIAAIFLRVFPLEMQKRIVDTAIALKRTHLLFTYCLLYLGAMVAAGLFKYLINVLQGYIGQKILLQMRMDLYEHLLSLPLTFYRKTPAGMVISSLTSELSAIGNFLGGSLAVPVTGLMTLFAFAGYMIYLNPLLAGCSLAIYPFEVIVIPILQKRFNRLNRIRVDTTRTMSNVIGEAVAGIHEVHGNAAYEIEKNKFEQFARYLFNIRHKMNIYRFGIKFTNNFFQNLGPFILFLLGGYLAIKGRFDLGSLVAFLSAYEKLYDPWRELMDYYQSLQDSRVRYRRVMEYFDVEPEIAIAPVGRPPYELNGLIEAQELTCQVDARTKLLDRVSLTVHPGQQLGVVGFSGSGKSTLAMVLGQLYPYSHGKVALDGREIKALSKLDVSENIGYVPQFPFIFEGSVRENLLYACRAISLADERRRDILPSREQVLKIVDEVGLHDDIFRFGLNSTLTRKDHADLVARLVEVRRLFHHHWGEKLSDQVEFFDINEYLEECTVYENIVFGDAVQEDFQLERAPSNPVFRKFLRESGLFDPLIALGRHLATQTVTLLKDLGDDAFFFEASPIPVEQFQEYQRIVERIRQREPSKLDDRETDMLLLLALRFTPARHKMAALPRDLETLILQARPMFIRQFGRVDVGRCFLGVAGIGREGMEESFQRPVSDEFAFYCAYEYLFHRNILDNILFGSLRSNQPQAADYVQSLILDLLSAEGLVDEVMELGMDFQVGSKGDRLSGGQKQKLSLARALLKNPHILILDEATASLDHTSQIRIQEVLHEKLKGKVTIVSVAHQLDLVKGYDQIAVLRAGKLVEMGTYDDLMSQKGVFYELTRGN